MQENTSSIRVGKLRQICLIDQLLHIALRHHRQTHIRIHLELLQVLLNQNKDVIAQVIAQRCLEILEVLVDKSRRRTSTGCAKNQWSHSTSHTCQSWACINFAQHWRHFVIWHFKSTAYQVSIRCNNQIMVLLFTIN